MKKLLENYKSFKRTKKEVFEQNRNLLSENEILTKENKYLNIRNKILRKRLNDIKKENQEKDQILKHIKKELSTFLNHDLGKEVDKHE